VRTLRARVRVRVRMGVRMRVRARVRVRVRVRVSVAVRVRVKLLAEPHLGQTRPPSTASSAPRAPATRRTLRRRARTGAARATCAARCAS